jgi:hypothetical protein
VTLPIRRSINDLADAYPKNAFIYDADQVFYICPAGERVTCKTVSRKQKRHMYTREGCDARLQENPDLMRQRMAIVERPFAILKQIMGFRCFLCWDIERARSKMGLSVLSYNLNSMINHKGAPALLAILR